MNNSDNKIIVRRRDYYEEPQDTHLEFYISNGRFSATVDIYCSVEDIKNIGNGLLDFPQKIGAEFLYTYGSEKPEDRFYRLFSMRAYTTDAKGHCALQFRINLNEKEPLEGQSVFSLPAEAHAINRLGKLLLHFSELRHKELQWSDKDEALLLEQQELST